MAEINTTSYLAIADDYDAAIAALDGIDQHYYDAAYEILILSVFDPELDLLQPFYNAYLATNALYVAPISAVTAIAELQRHVLNRARDANGNKYANIDAWYAADAGTFTNALPQNFADVSQQAGFTISSTYIA